MSRVAYAQNQSQDDIVQGVIKPQTHLIQLYLTDPEKGPQKMSESNN